MAFLGFGMFVLFGFVYNVGLSKESRFGIITMALSYVGLAIWSWSLSHSIITTAGICLFICIGMAITIQIAVFGELKDIEHDKYSIVKSLGVEIKDGRMINTIKLQLVYVIGRVLMFVPLLIVLVLSFNNISLVRFILACIWLAFGIALYGVSTKLILGEQDWDRKKILFKMNVTELATVFLPFPLFIMFKYTILIAVVTVGLWALLNKIVWNDYVQKI
jgi:4-hydroxybenzoate polyprenyltransferase